MPSSSNPREFLRRIRPSDEIMTISAIMGFYFVMTSGLIHVITMKPPSMGTGVHKSGETFPVSFKKDDTRNQYIFEGFAGGAMYMLGALGIILVSKAFKVDVSSRSRQILVASGALIFAVAYNVCLAFMRIKIPNYMAA